MKKMSNSSELNSPKFAVKNYSFFLQNCMK